MGLMFQFAAQKSAVGRPMPGPKATPHPDGFRRKFDRQRRRAPGEILCHRGVAEDRRGVSGHGVRCDNRFEIPVRIASSRLGSLRKVLVGHNHAARRAERTEWKQPFVTKQRGRCCPRRSGVSAGGPEYPYRERKRDATTTTWQAASPHVTPPVAKNYRSASKNTRFRVDWEPVGPRTRPSAFLRAPDGRQIEQFADN